jgi:hypothetical protein
MRVWVSTRRELFGCRRAADAGSTACSRAYAASSPPLVVTARSAPPPPPPSPPSVSGTKSNGRRSPAPGAAPRRAQRGARESARVFVCATP